MATAVSESDIVTQKNKISSLIDKLLIKGDTWYLVNCNWYKQWKKYVGYDSWDTSFVGEASVHPGVVDNFALLKQDTDELRENLIAELDYQLVPDEAWNLFLSWYGLREGQQPIARKVIEQGFFLKHCKIEVYLINLKLCLFGDLENPIIKEYSLVDTIQDIETTMRSIFGISEDKLIRLWNVYLSKTYEQLKKLGNTIQEAGLYQGQVIVMELLNDDGTWPRQASELQQRQSSANFQNSKSVSVPQNPPKLQPEGRSVKSDKKTTDPIEELITCVVCFSIMQDPRGLPCQHTFCFGCVKKLKIVTQNRKRGFNCPTCREFTIMQDARKSFMANQLIDIHHDQVQSPAGIFCKKHPNTPLKARCVPCKVDICFNCKFEEHDTHKSETFEVAIQRNLTTVFEKINKISSDIDAMNLEITALNVKELTVRDHKAQLKFQIKKQQQELLSEVDEKYHSTENDISMKVKSLQKDIDDRELFVAKATTSIGIVEGYSLLKVLKDIDTKCDKMKEQSGHMNDEVEIPVIIFEKGDIRIETLFGKICTENQNEKQ